MVSKAEGGSSRATRQCNQGATCGPLEGVSGQWAPSPTSRGDTHPKPEVCEGGLGENQDKKRATTALERWLALTGQQAVPRAEDQVGARVSRGKRKPRKPG